MQIVKNTTILFEPDFVLLQIVLQKTEIMNQGKTVFAQIMSLIQKKNSTSA